MKSLSTYLRLALALGAGSAASTALAVDASDAQFLALWDGAAAVCGHQNPAQAPLYQEGVAALFANAPKGALEQARKLPEYRKTLDAVVANGTKSQLGATTCDALASYAVAWDKAHHDHDDGGGREHGTLPVAERGR